jgi:hypothetical protein
MLLQIKDQVVDASDWFLLQNGTNICFKKNGEELELTEAEATLLFHTLIEILEVKEIIPATISKEEAKESVEYEEKIRKEEEEMKNKVKKKTRRKTKIVDNTKVEE